MMTKSQLEEAKIEFLKSFTNYCNTLLDESRRQKSLNYFCINVKTAEKLKSLTNEIKEL